MDVFIYFAGLVIGVTVFLYIFSLVNTAKERPAGGKTQAQPCPAESIEPGTIAFRKRPALPPGTRVCPMCGSPLTRYEGLYASKLDDKSGTRLIIMGCRYCYAEGETGASRKSVI